MQKTLIIILLVAVIVLAGVIVYQKLNQPAVNQPVVTNQLQNNLQEESIDYGTTSIKNLMSNLYYKGFDFCVERLTHLNKDSVVKLVNGTYDFSDPKTIGYGAYVLLDDVPVIADINKDDKKDVLVVLREFCGGNASQGFLSAVVYRDGTFINTDTIALGDLRSSFDISLDNNGFIIVKNFAWQSDTGYEYRIQFSNDKFKILETKEISQ